MADLEACCDSEDEIFFGPVTEKEKNIADRVRRRALLPQELKASLDALSNSSQDGEEGLHALAMAAQMLSISSSQEKHVKEEVCFVPEIKQEREHNACCDISPSVDSSMSYDVDNKNEGCPLELDAVKFLAQRLPENHNHSGFSVDLSRSSSKTSPNSGPIHYTSFASVENNPDETVCCFNNGLDVQDSLPHGLNIMEADVKIADLRMNGTNDLNVDTISINDGMRKIEKPDSKLDSVSKSDQLTELKFSNVDWEDANEISRSDFELKTSDNEEELDKVERNLKVEEIIKFLADEEVKTEVEGEKRSSLEDMSMHLKSSLQGDILDVCYEDSLNSEVKENETIEMDDCKVVFNANNSIRHSCKESEIKLEEPNNFNVVETECTHADVKVVTVDQTTDVHEMSDRKDEIDTTNMDRVACKELDVKLEEPNLFKFSETESTYADVKLVTVDQAADILELNDCKDDDITNSGSDSSKESGVKLEEPNNFNVDESEPKNVDVKLEKLNQARDMLTKEDNKKVVVNTISTSVESQKLKKLKTPKKVQLKPLTDGPNLIKNSLPYEYTHSPMAGVDGKRHPGTPRPTKKSPMHAHIPSGIPLMQSTGTTNGNHFKTPNSKSRTLTMPKIPRLRSPVTPSPRKNKKFAGIVSPVAQYIHGNPVLLIANKKPMVGHSGMPCSKQLISDTAADKLVLPILHERGTENVDMNNVSGTSLPGNINYKSALPVKIFSSSPNKCQITGPAVTVTKHLGRVKLDCVRSGDAVLPFLLQCRESMMPDGEVSLLISQEVGLTHSTSP